MEDERPALVCIPAKLGSEPPAQESAGHAWGGSALMDKPNLIPSWTPDELLTVCLHDSIHAHNISHKLCMDCTADAPEGHHCFFPIQQLSHDQLTSAPTLRRGLAAPLSAPIYTCMNRARRTLQFRRQPRQISARTRLWGVLQLAK